MKVKQETHRERAQRDKDRWRSLEENKPTRGAKNSFAHKAYGSWGKKEIRGGSNGQKNNLRISGC